MSKFWFIVDIVCTFIILMLMLWNVVMGISNHDAYYLTLGIIDYIFLKINVKNINVKNIRELY